MPSFACLHGGGREPAQLSSFDAIAAKLSISLCGFLTKMTCISVPILLVRP